VLLLLVAVVTYTQAASIPERETVIEIETGPKTSKN
jgi:hypothetical protein